MKEKKWNPKSSYNMRMALVNRVLDTQTAVSTEEWLDKNNLKDLENLTDNEISEILLMKELHDPS